MSEADINTTAKSRKQVSDNVWDLIQKLSTNEAKFNEVLKVFDGIKETDKDNQVWAKTFEKKNEYHKQYTRDILMKLMKEQKQTGSGTGKQEAGDVEVCCIQKVSDYS